jgi:hypothetical protein
MCDSSLIYYGKNCLKFCSPNIRRQSVSIVERHSNEVPADNAVLNIPVCEKRYIVYYLSNFQSNPVSLE